MAHESKKEYEVIARIEADKLTKPLGLKPIKQGQHGVCPHCERNGRFDFTIGYAFQGEGENHIYWSTVHNGWMCDECEIIISKLGPDGLVLVALLDAIEAARKG